MTCKNCNVFNYGAESILCRHTGADIKTDGRVGSLQNKIV